MQLSLALDPDPFVGRVHARLLAAFGDFSQSPRMEPVDQLIKSLISGRTYDEVSWAAYLRLRDVFKPWDKLAEASPEAVQAAIAQVTHAEIKAGWLPQTLSRIIAERGTLDLDFLASAPLAQALTWLKSLPGVGDHTAAAVLNFSALRRPVMVIDTHVWRVARRLGLAPRDAEPEAVRRAITDAAPADWDGDTFFDLHWLLKRLGQTLCQHDQTRCGACPAAALCEQNRRSQASGRPGPSAVVAAFRRETRP